MTFTKGGFGKLERTGITLEIGQVLKLDASLAVGLASESVTVEADASPLATETSIIGTNMKSRDLTILPLSVAGGRDVSRFALATVPTVVADDQKTGYDFQSGTKIAGSQGVTKAVVVDGTDYNAGIQGVQPPPGMEAVQEFEVQTVVGQDAFATGGGAFMYTLKSGTNAFHGSAYGILANEALNANSWMNNHEGNPKDRDRYNDWGISGGGPVYLPKIYNGQNKTFFFVSFERYDQTDLRWIPNSRTVPTTDMLNGDFSALLGAPLCSDGTLVPNCGAGATPLMLGGQPVRQGMIFDPSTGLPFPGNIIPPDRISTQSKKVIDLFKQYFKPDNNGLILNYGSLFNSTPLSRMTNLDLKVDQHFSEKNHLSGSLNYSRQPITSANLWSRGTANGGPLAGDSDLAAISSRSLRFIDDHTFTTHVINTISAAYNDYRKDEVTANPVDNSALGFPVPLGAAKNNFPQIEFGSVLTNGQTISPDRIGSRFGYDFWFNQWHVRDNVSWLKGRHSFKFGGELILYRPADTGGAQNYWYQFRSDTGLPVDLVQSGAANQLGFGLANFLLGDVSQAQHGVSLPTSAGRNGFNFFAGDTIKVTQKLTVNGGLRWEFNGRYHEYSGRWTNFNTEAINPSWAPLKGAYEYASKSSDSWETNQFYNQFAPYVGASYQVLPKLVARGSWGMHYVPLGLNQWGALPYNLFNEAHAGYVGASNTSGAFNWDQNIYPGVDIPSSTDPSANRIHPWFSDGGTVSIDPNMLKMGRVQNWNFGLEFQLGASAVLSANYIGNRGRGLHNGGLDPRTSPTWEAYKPLLMSGHIWDFIYDQASAQAAGVPWYPFLVNEVGNWAGGYPAWDAIAPFPQLIDWKGSLRSHRWTSIL